MSGIRRILKRIMAVQKSLLGFCVALFLASCAIQYDFSQMPKYDMAEAISHYYSITDSEIYYLSLNQVVTRLENLGIFVDKEKLYPSVDIYLYWSSVARIQLFHGDYTESDQSLKKAIIGLDQLKALLIEIIKDKGI